MTVDRSTVFELHARVAAAARVLALLAENLGETGRRRDPDALDRLNLEMAVTRVGLEQSARDLRSLLDADGDVSR